MTLSNFPPGVSGNETQIAGDDYERDETRHVDACDYLRDSCTFSGGDVEGELYGDHACATFAWICPGCDRDYSKDIFF